MGRLAEMQRKLLEQMMGPEAMGVANANLVWTDEKVCRNFLCGTCPHTLFTNTKMDLGACPKSHTERLKTEFNAAKEANPSDSIFARFQLEYESNIFSFVDECDRRIRAAHRRLEKTPEENAKTTNLMREIGEIELAIQGGTEKIEQLGEQGKVEESMREMAAIEALKNEKGDKEMHLGYHELRNMLQAFKAEREKAKASAPPASAAPASSNSTGRERGSEYRRDEHRDRGYDRHSSSRYE
ncbi:hypothetical protein MKEN_01212400 [Mycena kentingensis (nom. inval.)]|nr:hypothetical protein MKEN_01212400 [Mycena kentingensis (nom. inval.)]